MTRGDANPSPRAFLIGLRAPQGDDDTLPDVLNVGVIEADQLRPPEPAREANEQQRPVARILQRAAAPAPTARWHSHHGYRRGRR
jgi:hypothetical protein